MLLQERQVGRKKTLILGVLPPRVARRGRRWPWLLAGLALILLSLAVVHRIQQRSEGGAETIPQEGISSVRVVRPQRAGPSEVTLPANLHAYQATDLYPRVDGFVKAWKVEIGARVKAGQIVAEIDTPELDQEVARAEAQTAQASADLEQSKAELEEARSDVALGKANVLRARANLDFASTQTQRLRRLLTTRAAGQEELDRTISDRDARAADFHASEADLKKRQTALGTREATIRSREATLANNQANVRRLRELQGFKHIVAPFDGVVTKRNAEVGILVSAGNTTSARPLFRVVQTDVLRVQVPVPQAFAVGVKDGDRAAVSVPEYPDRTFPARVARSAGEIDPATRTVLVELELPNDKSELLPGTYAQVRIVGRRLEHSLLVPASAVLMRPEGSQVAVVNGGEVRLRKVELGRDLGSKVEVLTGLTSREQVVANPTDDLRDGKPVEVSGDETVATAGLSRLQ